jgi:serine/threonine protein kinase
VIGLYDVISTTIKSADYKLIEDKSSSASFRRHSMPRHLGDLYLVFEYMDTDLSNIIKSNQYVQTEHIQFILYQILCGLMYTHSANVIHR